MHSSYKLGICDDGENICASIENMLLQCAEEMDIRLDTNRKRKGLNFSRGRITTMFPWETLFISGAREEK